MDGSAASLEVEEITSTAGLEALRSEWWALWRRTPEATPFQSPAWLLPWWQIFGQGELLTLAFREHGRLTGLLPLYVLKAEGCRKLLPLGIGITDRLDPLLTAALARLAVRHLASRAHVFDRIDLMELAADSPLLSVAAPEGWGDEVQACEPRPVLTLPQGPEELRRAVPRLGKLGYYRRRAAALGRAEIRTATERTLAEHLDALFRLHGARWTERGEPGVLADREVQAFHRLAAAALLSSGLLRGYALHIDDRIAAVLHGFADRRRFHAYLGGHDPDLRHPGPGALMIGHAIEEACREGLESFDFLRGREPYKYAWGAVDHPACGRRLQPAAQPLRK